MKPLLTIAIVAFSSLASAEVVSTQNFVVRGDFAAEIANNAESMRTSLAVEWLGRELPSWREKCPITVHANPHVGAGGTTAFSFSGSEPSGWDMRLQGSRELILNSVLPHEITHTIFATHFRRPLPRWADEGACITIEDANEQRKYSAKLYDYLTTRRGIAFNEMFAMTEYPRDVLPLYAQGHSLARYLLNHDGGKRHFVNYLAAGMSATWTEAGKTHYGYENLSHLQTDWLEWVRKGSPPT